MEQESQLAFSGMPVPTSDREADRAHTPQERRRKVIQDLLLEEGLWAVTRAHGHGSIESLEEDLLQNLKQQSEETRRRYVSSLIRWFFPNRQLASPASLVWQAYGDRGLTFEVLRVLYLKSEPIVGQCVEEFLYPISANAVIPASYFDSYLRSSLGDIPKKTRGRLTQNLRKLGFLAKAQPGRDLLHPLNPSATCLFLMFTYYFAQDEVRTVEVPTVLADPFWKYLGLKSEDAVRKVFREANNQGVLAKYVVADRLELVTTFLTFAQCLQKRVRL